MIFQGVILLLGFGLLIKGADWFVDGASALARKYNVSNLTVGLTVVAFGTSAPELVVNVFASIGNHQEIVVGNVVGSNIFNLYMILGITGLIAPLVVQSSTVWKEIPLSLLAAIILFILTFNLFDEGPRMLSRLDGFMLIFMFGVFMFYIYRQLQNENVEYELSQHQLSTLKLWSLIFFGLVFLIFGGKLVVDNAILLATSMGVSEKIIALTIVAAGTSLPELVTSVVAVLKKNNDIAVGNIIGSNIFNIFLILSVSTLIRPITYEPKFDLDLYVLAGGTLFLFVAMFTGQKKRLDRWEAGVLLISFLVYSAFLFMNE